MIGWLRRRREQRQLEQYREVDELARKVLLWYLQSWNQSREERGMVLMEAGRWCGFRCHLEVTAMQVIPQIEGGQEDLAVWQEFRAAIERCWPIGSWEKEHSAVVGVLQRFRVRLEAR